MAARVAAKMGYTNIRVYHAGVPDWAAGGNILLADSEFVDKSMGFTVLIDTRGPEVAKKGYIQGAVAIRLNDIPMERNQFPVDRKAFIILYSQQTDQAAMAPVVKEIASWGYKNVLVLDGGYEAWVKNNGAIQKDRVLTKIYYLPRPHPGEIVGDEFMNIVNTKPQDKIILDVRTKEEAAMGTIPGAVNIPVEEIQVRITELPKDKEIITHCRTGLRAEMGYSILRNNGYNARFLNDKVAIVEEELYCCFK